MAQDLPLTLLLADYHRTHPILAGEIKARGIEFAPHRAEAGLACMKPVYEEYDIAEMSMSWYVMARSRGEPVVALPIFPLRMQIHPYIFCSASAPIERPEDLKGKRIGMDQYRLTVGLWARGILQEHYGVRPEWGGQNYAVHEAVEQEESGETKKTILKHLHSADDRRAAEDAMREMHRLLHVYAEGLARRHL